MGDYLPFIDLATSDKMIDISILHIATCSLSNNGGDIRCWGENIYGNLVFLFVSFFSDHLI